MSYYNERRKLLDNNGFEEYPLIIIINIKDADFRIEEIEKLIHSL